MSVSKSRVRFLWEQGSHGKTRHVSRLVAEERVRKLLGILEMYKSGENRVLGSLTINTVAKGLKKPKGL